MKKSVKTLEETVAELAVEQMVEPSLPRRIWDSTVAVVKTMTLTTMFILALIGIGAIVLASSVTEPTIAERASDTAGSAAKVVKTESYEFWEGLREGALDAKYWVEDTIDPPNPAERVLRGIERAFD